MRIILFISLFLYAASLNSLLKKIKAPSSDWRTAALTTFTSYASCCKKNPNYDPNADTSECSDYSACKYSGDFAAISHQSFDWVKSHNIISFYDDSDKKGKNFLNKYGGKTIRLRKNGKEFSAQIADTCGNSDCGNCCHKNSKSGFLVDIEYWTVMKNLGSIDQADGTIEFIIDS